MADPAGRRFSREETALILRRATEGEQRLEAGREGALTLDEIVAAARDAGIDVAAVRRAAAISGDATDASRSRLVGATVDPTVHAVFTGTVPPERHGAARIAIERAIRRKGELESVGSSFTWREEHGLGRTSIEASVVGSSVEVTGHAERKGHLLALFFSLAIVVGVLMLPLGGFGGLAALTHPLVAVLGPIAAILLGTRLVWPALQRPAIRALEAAVLEVGALVEERGPAQLESGETGADR